MAKIEFLSAEEKAERKKEKVTDYLYSIILNICYFGVAVLMAIPVMWLYGIAINEVGAVMPTFFMAIIVTWGFYLINRSPKKD